MTKDVDLADLEQVANLIHNIGLGRPSYILLSSKSYRRFMGIPIRYKPSKLGMVNWEKYILNLPHIIKSKRKLGKRN